MERVAGNDVVNKGVSGTCGYRSTRGCNLRLGEWFQQIPGTTSELQRSTVLGSTQILHRSLVKGQSLEETRPPTKGEWGIFLLFISYEIVSILICFIDISYTQYVYIYVFTLFLLLLFIFQPMLHLLKVSCNKSRGS